MKLELPGKKYLGRAHEDEALPAELARMRSLRVLGLDFCGLRTVPAFVSEALDLYWNDFQIGAPLDFLIEGCPPPT